GGQRAGPDDLGGLAGVGVTWGPHADSERIYTYDPAKRGLIVSDDDLATVRSDARGLYTGALVKEGACVRASANGAVFYGIANDRLYVGRRAAGRLAVAGAAADPPVLTYEEGAYLEAMKGTREDIAALGRSRRAAPAARQLLARVAGSRSFLSADQVAVTARVTSAAGPPARVSVDLSRLGGSGLTPMADDGVNGDGAAGDGVYGVVLHLDPRRFSQNAADARRRPPGLMGLTVTAAAADGALASEIAVLSLFNRLESFDVETRTETIRVEGGPWTHSLGSPYYIRDISQYQALVLRLRTDLEAGEEVRVQLADLPAFALPVTTPPVPVVGEGFVEGGRIGREWRQVVIPLKRLVRDAPDFRPARWAYVILSGDGRTAGTYEVTGARFLIRAEEAKAIKGASPK
ncbi:MAG: hypothetical protein IMZ66_01100, partial [Planctomycetes bacterium]|nr:hypothetical protein [Planctomycetota bacterium]